MFKSKTWHVHVCGRELKLLLKINQTKLKAKMTTKNAGVLFPKNFDILLLKGDVLVRDDRIYICHQILQCEWKRFVKTIFINS